MNLKGGIGKTTLSANISRALIELRPVKILLVDTDPQSSLTLIFKNEDEVDNINEGDTFYDILCNPTEYMPQKIESCIVPVYSSGESRIDLIPSHVQIIRPMIQAMTAGVRAGQALRFDLMGQNFENFIVEAKRVYDLVILDTNPSGNLATFLAIKNSNYIIAPVTGNRFAIRGVSLMREVFENEFDWLSRERFRLIPLINDVNDSAEGVAVRDQLHQRGNGLGDQALQEYVFHSKFLAYTEKKQGFAIDRGTLRMNIGKQKRLRDNLKAVASALEIRTRLYQ
jgi:chromosome partitioning protein